MSLVGFLILIFVIVILLYVANKHVNVPQPFLWIFNGAALLILLVILLQLAGVDLLGVKIGR